ncbi:hypothetical protein [uncultured Bacteroides sp.]|uniref:hypothetical protein n=1 Tax=uncultured Bacteroides sp. TaxID=162156 RepID=UPI0026080896|nr:hypothetical protein [uncultured Bacteroides sp.]
MMGKCLYCILWSVGLFVATFYCLLAQDEEAFDFTGKELLPIAQSHIMPMIMAMALYLWDVLYSLSMQKMNRDRSLFWILAMIIVFMITFVSSILVNCNVLGWVLFILSWLSLTILKYQTTENGQTFPYPISED